MEYWSAKAAVLGQRRLRLYRGCAVSRGAAMSKRQRTDYRRRVCAHALSTSPTTSMPSPTTLLSLRRYAHAPREAQLLARAVSEAALAAVGPTLWGRFLSKPSR
jgi:hypothetical protein